MNLQHLVVENAFVRLEPLAEPHKEGLRAACAADPEVWLKLYPFSMLGEHFEPVWQRMIQGRLLHLSRCYAVLHKGRVVGMSSFIDVDERNGTLEIGGTYYEPSVRGGCVNPAAKHTMMSHAFDSGAGRVQLKVDALNARSRAAVLKLGAVQEGVLRRDRVTWTGRLRDTVVFSVLDHEWPAVRAKLEARLAVFAQEIA